MKMHKINIMIVFVSLIYLYNAEAALQVTAFSCNSQTGTVTVDNLASLTCQATVNNPDQSTATLNSVVLYPSGNWLESSSYTGSGFDTSISAGASTVASFTGLTPNVAGLNAFDNINLDGVIDTFVVDTTMNIIDIKSIIVTPSVGSGDQNTEFDLQASVTGGGDNDDSTIVVDLGNCGLKTGESATIDSGAIANNAQVSHTWKIIMGDNHCTYTVTATGFVGATTTSDSASGTVTNNNPVTTTTTAGSSSGGAGGGGGGGSASGEAKPAEDTGFDIDFSSEGVGELVTKALQGQVLSLSFDGATKHSVTIAEVREDSVTLIIESTPKTIVVKLGETINVDLNDDGLNDMSVTLLGVLGQSANLKFTKIEEGAKVLAQEETKARLEREGLVTTTLSPVLSGEKGGLGWMIFGVIFVLVIAGLGLWMKHRHENGRRGEWERRRNP